MPKNFLTLRDLDAKALTQLIDEATRLKAQRGKKQDQLQGKSVALILEKPSTRTRISFEIGVRELGGHVVTLIGRDTQLGRGESLEDTARMLSRYVHGVVFRTTTHDRLESLAKASSVPIINGLSDQYHPCQILADLLTVKEHLGRVKDFCVAWIGDGNNVANSWIEASALLGFELRLACPVGHEPDAKLMKAAHQWGADIKLMQDMRSAAAGADVVTTDVWTSMGQEKEAQKRLRTFTAFQVNAELMKHAKKDAIFLHCLPAHRGEEVTADVLEGAQSRVWDEAENRLHTQKALLLHLLK